MAHIKKLNFLKNHKDLVDENYGMVAVPTFSDKMDKDLEELFKSQNKTGKVGDLVFEIDNNSRIVYYGLGCLLYTSPSPRDVVPSRMPSSA